MEYELVHIESVVAKVLRLTLCGELTDDEFQKAEKFLSSEYVRIKTVFRKTVLRPQGKAYFKEYFGLHQVALVELMDNIFDTRAEMSVRTNTYSSVIEFLFRSIDNLLSLIKDEFFGFFLDGIAAPKWTVEQAHKNLSSKMEVLRIITANRYVESELIDPLLSVFHDSLCDRNGKMTFKQVDYLTLLYDEVVKIDFSIDDGNWRRMNLCNTLIKLNFNDQQFFQFYSNHITRALLSCETLSDRIDQAAYFYKIISQVTVINGVGLNNSALDIKHQLLEWMTSELDYLRQKERLQIPAKTDSQIKNDFKIIFDLSVSQLAYIFKIFIDTGVIQNKNASEIIRFLSRFVKTKRAESVSYESLRVKFYDAESGTKDAVKKTLQSLLSYINKH
ncbi:hypothetical protein [Chryseolinea sp. H1M3-3]|uniref:hypothetical protein n=1 Tax=Chryseolinea sp. H1M3-3 TaxID=3034144 RepID=UPI0023EC844D|nr:hypothetical protein [Chryseolinea sp. H1M3-3]